MTYTVPDGWANSSDWPSTFGLTPSTAYDALPASGQEGSQSILIVAQETWVSQPAACSSQADTTVAHTVEAEITWLRQVHGLITSAPTQITVDGPRWPVAGCSAGPGLEDRAARGPWSRPDIGVGAGQPSVSG